MRLGFPSPKFTFIIYSVIHWRRIRTPRSFKWHAKIQDTSRKRKFLLQSFVLQNSSDIWIEYFHCKRTEMIFPVIDHYIFQTLLTGSLLLCPINFTVGKKRFLHRRILKKSLLKIDKMACSLSNRSTCTVYRRWMFFRTVKFSGSASSWVQISSCSPPFSSTC